MRVEFIRPVASPGLSARAGQVVDVPEDEALRRIELGHCVAVDQPRTRLRDRLPGRRKPEAKPKSETPAGADKLLEKYTVDELKAFADEHDISIPEDGKKADILAAVTAALAEREGTQQ